MREIKFRAWDWKEKTMLIDDMVEIKLTDSKPEVSSAYSASDGGSFFKGDYKLMQFTGEMDEHVEEIYEGDILESVAFIDEVIFEDGRFKFKRDQGKGSIVDHYPYTIKGNIYQNPELINLN